MDSHLQALEPGVRALSAEDLGIGVAAAVEKGHASTSPDAPSLNEASPEVQRVVKLASQFGGVILTGPPGTSKTFLAAEVARVLTANDPRRMWFVQFHASYQYEDFIQGFAPKKDGSGFEPRRGPFLEACKRAAEDPGNAYVVVIDELSRVDVGRVFGEALTYVDRTKRGLPFTIASGDTWVVPPNLVILATMNPQDRGVDEVDAAFERRFAKIGMEPDAALLRTILGTNGVDQGLIDRVELWFKRVNGQAKKNPMAAVGHAYFVNVVDEPSLQELWDYQLKFLVERAFRLDQETGDGIAAGWARVFEARVDATATAETPSPSSLSHTSDEPGAGPQEA